MATVYKFKITDSWDPSTLPMQRLAEYMEEFAKILGERDHVHFEGVEPGSAVLAARVDAPAQSQVQERVRGLHAGTPFDDVRRAAQRLDDFLAADNAVGELSVDEDNVLVVAFAGRDRLKAVEFGPFREEGSLEGQIVSIGGRDETIHVHLREGTLVYSSLVTDVEMARRLAPHMFGPVVRVHGTGRWIRTGDGGWELKDFRITRFDVLEDTPLTQVVGKLRGVAGNEWDRVPDPVAFLLAERHGDDS